MFRFINGFVLFPLLEKYAKRDVFSKLDELKKYEKLTLKDQLQIQKNELHKILQHCQSNVPYYKDLFVTSGFDIDSVLKDIRHIEKLPILTKQIIRENRDRIVLPSAIHPRKTGGSTGQSVFFYYDNVGLDWTSAINLMAYEMAHNYVYRNDAHISSELGFNPPPLKHRLMDWLKLFAQNRQRLMIRSFSDEDLAESFKQLKKIKPYLLQGHPSSGYAIAQYIQRKGLPLKKYCDVFEPSGEMLTEKMVQSMEKHLGCKVVNRYGNAEFGVMAHSRFEDTYRKLKVFNRAFFIEECTQSNLIVTNYTNYCMPLIRYDTGDIATVKNENDGTFIYDLQGRVHDTVKIANEDYATHYIMDYLDHKIRNIREFQILLQKNKNPLINIVPESREDASRIEKEFKDRWPQGIDVHFIDYEDLKKVGWQQKFRHVIDMRES